MFKILECRQCKVICCNSTLIFKESAGEIYLRWLLPLLIFSILAKKPQTVSVREKFQIFRLFCSQLTDADGQGLNLFFFPAYYALKEQLKSAAKAVLN